MPDRGLMEATAAPSHALNGGNPGPWLIEDATVFQLTYQADQASALAVMPTETTKPIPTYCRLIVIEAGSSPVGPFKLAALFAGARHNLLPRNVLVDGIVDGPSEALLGAFGGGFRPGSISITRDDPELTATISADEGELATAHAPALRAVDPAMIRWDTWLAFVDDDGAVNLADIVPDVQASEAYLSKGATLTMPRGLPRGHTWRKLRNLQTITACLVTGAMHLPPPELKQRWT